jgi:hypothetical protein
MSFAGESVAELVKHFGESERPGQPNPVPAAKKIVKFRQSFAKGLEASRQQQQGAAQGYYGDEQTRQGKDPPQVLIQGG